MNREDIIERLRADLKTLEDERPFGSKPTIQYLRKLLSDLEG